MKYLCFFVCSYGYGSEVSYGAGHGSHGYPYGTVGAAHGIGYDISADFVDSTTAYDPRPGTGAATPLDTLPADTLMGSGVPTGTDLFLPTSNLTFVPFSQFATKLMDDSGLEDGYIWQH